MTQARLDIVLAACTVDYFVPADVVDVAAQLLAAWRESAAGLGITGRQLDDIDDAPVLVLFALAAALEDAQRHRRARHHNHRGDTP